MILKTTALLLLLLPRFDEEGFWKALEAGALDKAKEIAGKDVAKVYDLLKRGHPVGEGVPGESTERLTDAFGSETDLWTIVPKSYDKSKPSGVLIMLHGLGGTGAQLKDLCRNFAEEHGMIVAAPTAQREPDKAKNEDNLIDLGNKKASHWWCYRDGNFPFSALSVLKRRFAIDENRVVLTGYSMGGFGTWNIGLRYPDRFSALVAYAGGISRLEYVSSNDERMRKILLNAFNLPVYFIHGDADTTVPVTFDRRSRDQLKGFGYEHVYVEVPKAGHLMNVKEGGELMTGVETWLNERVRRPHPKEVRHHAIGDYAPQSYWMRIVEFKDNSAEVKASIKGQTIDFTSTGAKKVAFYIDETLLDLSKPIKVTSGGATLFQGKVPPSMDVVLETWRAREDRELLFRAKVVVDVK